MITERNTNNNDIENDYETTTIPPISIVTLEGEFKKNSACDNF